MTNPERNQRYNTTFFFTALGVAAMLVIASAGLVAKALTYNTEGGGSHAQVCLGTLKKNGMPPTVQGETITVRLPQTNEIEANVNKAGVVIAACANYKIAKFCAGPDCKPAGVIFELIPR